MSRGFEHSTPDPSFAAFNRHRAVGGAMLVTNQVGQYVLLNDDEFASFVQGTVDRTSELYRRLCDAGLVRAEVDVADLGARLARRKDFLRSGPNLHIMVVTLRCNQTCVYCHSSRAPLEARGFDMTREMAGKVVDLVFDTTSPAITIEFQGGEPLVNWEVIVHTIEYATKKNRKAHKTLEFSLVSNLSLMDDARLAYLLDHKVQICTSIDGTRDLHNAQRILVHGDAWGETNLWLRKINRAYIDAGLDPDVYHVEALPTITRPALADPKALIDTYVEFGCKAIFLRRLDPFGFAAKDREQFGYTSTEFLDFYRTAVDYIIELNRDGTQILERTAAIFLTKILGERDPNFLDIRSPCGAGIGQVAYNYDGRIFTCDEGRMVGQTGDDFFLIGQAGDATYGELMLHPTVRAITIASNLDASPDCVNCAYNPYCGICPVVNYATQGSLHGQMRTSDWCAVHKGIQDYLFTKLHRADPAELQMFERWITVRPRDHYLHEAPTR